MPDNVAVVRHFIDNFNAGDVAEAVTVFAPDIEYLGPVVPGVWWANGNLRGTEAILRGIIDGVDDHFTELSVHVDAIYECGDSDVVVISHHDGRTKGGIVFDSPLVQIYTVRDGQIVTLRDFADTTSWKRKLAADATAGQAG